MSYLLCSKLEVQTYEKREGEKRNCELSYNSPSGFKFVSGPNLLPNMKRNTQKGKSAFHCMLLFFFSVGSTIYKDCLDTAYFAKN